ncbi:unconventional myosin-XV-like isoform X2 [Symsagittifera roscoffensis]|uniref:unconventional myosin-XV-like isoform X2 n=1 Tax=Symsagittifera roscoffensis TaxID=84072 RepID=UPI00307C6DA8
MQQGDLVWFDSGLGFLSPGQVMQVKRNPYVVSILNEDTNERVQLPARTVLPVRERLPEPNGADDMVHLKDLHSGSILQNVMLRFENAQIYTYIGSILLSVNPYRLIKDMYGNRAIERYRDKVLGDQAPHLYAIANEAYVNVCTKNEDQVIVVSGESGAGKTESTKLILQYLTSVSSQRKLSKGKLISDQLLESSPLLESFGNAKTLRNDNSSRFGKFIEVKVADKLIVGAQVKEYLLEKSRIVYQAGNERNYHVFYEMLSGMSEQQKSKYGLSTPNYFHYLNQAGGDLSCVSKNDFEDFQRLISAMDVLSISQTEQDGIFSILAAILHLGNVQFVTQGEDGDDAKVKEDTCVHAVSSLLKVKPSDLVDDITYRVTETRDEKIFTALKIEEAIEARDGIAKALYAHLFKWLVQKVNKTIGKTLNAPAINLLDIFGFEVVPKNSFEQLCINYANESLQQVFIRSVFKTEQMEYQRERIEWHSLDYKDNIVTIELMSKKPTGLLHILDDQSNFPQASDSSFLEKASQVHSESEAFQVDRLRQLQFTVRHYAGPVSYSASGLLEKNKDRLRFETLCLLADSSHPLVSEIFAELHTFELDRTIGHRSGGDIAKLVASGKVTKTQATTRSQGALSKRKAPTVAAKFQTSLSNLITVIGHCNPFFVRCIKPNNTKSHKEFDRQLVVAQLNYLGILETIKIRKLGYPIRMYFAAFINRYRCLMLELYGSRNVARTMQAREICELYLKGLHPKYNQQFQLGLTKVFMREDLERFLEVERNRVTWAAAARIQSWARGVALRKKFLLKRQSAIVIQKYFRQYSAKQKYLRYKWAVTRLQAYRRGKQTRQHYLTLRSRHRTKTQQDAIRALEASIQQSNDVYLARMGATRQTMTYVVPEDLAEILSGDLSWANVEDDAVARIEHKNVALKLLNLELPDRIDSYSLSKYTNINLRGDLIWGECREWLQMPYHVRIHESYFPLVEMLNKTLLYCLYEESLSWEHMKVVCAYIIKIVQSEPVLRDEAYIQLCSQTWRLKNNMHQKRAWIIMCAFLDTFPPSPQFSNYLLKYVSDWAFNGYKSICQQKLLKCSLATNHVIMRRGPVTWLEWLANDRLLGTSIELSLLDSLSHLTQIDSWDTCEEVVLHLMHYLNLPDENCSGWTLSMLKPQVSQYSMGNAEPDYAIEELPGYSFVFDSIAETEYLSFFMQSSGEENHVTNTPQPASVNRMNSHYTNDDYPQPDYSMSSHHDFLIRGVKDECEKVVSQHEQNDSQPSQQQLVNRLMKAIKGEETNYKSVEPTAELNGDVNGSSDKQKKPAPVAPASHAVSQSIKVISNDKWDASDFGKPREMTAKEMKNSVKLLKQNKAGHVLKVAEDFKSQGIFLAGRGLGDHLDKKQMSVSQRNSAEKSSGGDQGSSRPRAGVALSGDSGSDGSMNGSLGEKALAVQRMMELRVKSVPDVKDARANLLNEMKRKNRARSEVYLGSENDGEDEPDNLFADTETGFSIPEPPAQFGAKTTTNVSKNYDTSVGQPRVAPPVAFSASTKTITENRKSLFNKDLAVQEDEKTHQEALRLLKRNSELKQERDNENKKPVRRESSKRPALNSLVASSKNRHLSTVYDGEAEHSVHMTPSEAVKYEMEQGVPPLVANGARNSISEVRSTTVSDAQIQKPKNSSVAAQREMTSSSALSSRKMSQTTNVSSSTNPTSITQGKVSSAVKRLDSVLNNQKPVVMKPEVYEFRTSKVENYKESVALTVRKFVIDDMGNTVLLRTKKTPFLRYDQVPWKFFVRKEMFSPTEKVEHPRLKTLLFHQIVSDVFSTGSRKLNETEQSEMIKYLTDNNVRNFNAANYIPDEVKDHVIQSAKSWKLYFTRIYPVLVHRDSIRSKSKYLNFTHIATSHSGLKLLSNENAEGEFKIVMEVYYPTIKVVQFEQKMKKLELRVQIGKQQMHEPIVVFTEQGYFLMRLIQKYRSELQNTTKALVKAVDHHHTTEIGDLQFRKGDVIRVLDEQPLEPALLGEVNGVVGQVSKSKIKTYHVIQETTDDYLNESVITTERAMALQADSDHSVVMSDQDVASMDSQSSVISWDLMSQSSVTDPSLPVMKGSMLEYAMNHFRPPKDSSAKVRPALAQDHVMRLRKRLHHTREPIKKSLTDLKAVSDNLYAVKVFRELLRYAGDINLKQKGEFKIVYEILKISKLSVQLSDEIYCQIIKQVTRADYDRGRDSGYFKYWRIFALLASYSQCSTTLKRYLWRFLNNSASRHPPNMRNLVLQNLAKTFKYGGRTELPGVSEMRAFCDYRSSKRQCFILPGGVVKTVKVFTATLISEAVSNLALQIGIHDPEVAQQFGVVLMQKARSGESYGLPLQENSYLMDILTSVESENKECDLRFHRLFWTVPINRFPPPAINAVFAQTIIAYKEGDLITANRDRPLSEEKFNLICKLVAIDVKLSAPDLEIKQIEPRIVYNFVPEFLQPFWNNGSFHPKQWANEVQKNLTELLRFAPDQAKQHFVELVSNLALFGAAIYPTIATENNRVAFVAVTKAGISCLNKSKGIPVNFIGMENILDVQPIKDKYKQCLIVKHGNFMHPSTDRINCSYVHEVANFVLGYRHRLGLTINN